MTKKVFDRRAAYGLLCMPDFESDEEAAGRYRAYIHEHVETYGLDWMPYYSEIWCNCTPDGQPIHTFPGDEIDFAEWFMETAEAAYEHALNA